MKFLANIYFRAKMIVIGAVATMALALVMSVGLIAEEQLDDNAEQEGKARTYLIPHFPSDRTI
jgi:hypothetical protein